MTISYTRDKVWWKEPLERTELIWIVIALIWCLIMFFMMPYWHIYGQQNLANEAYRAKPADFMQKNEDMIAKYKVREEGGEQQIQEVRPPAGADVFLVARLWSWYALLERLAAQAYRLDLMSSDWLHGVSLQPEN